MREHKTRQAERLAAPKWPKQAQAPNASLGSLLDSAAFLQNDALVHILQRLICDGNR